MSNNDWMATLLALRDSLSQKGFYSGEVSKYLENIEDELMQIYKESKATDKPMHEKYPAYFKDVSKLESIDVYRVHRLFGVNDPVIHHASKKLLMAGGRTGEKFEIDDVREARDSLTRWLAMEEEDRG